MISAHMIAAIQHRLREYRHFNLVKQFAIYVCVGGMATLVDWTTFYSLTHVAVMHYYPALAVSTTLGTLTHFTLNKLFTFKQSSHASKKLILIYIIIVSLSFGLNFLWMTFFVSFLHLHLMFSRMLTTGLMLIVNFALHKGITFNKALYSPR